MRSTTPQLLARFGGLVLALAALGTNAQPAPLAPTAANVPSSPLAEAAARSDVAALRSLLAAGKVDANSPDRDGTPALHWVTRVGDLETAKLLVAAGADVNVTNRLGVVPLHLAIQAGDAEPHPNDS